MIEHREDRFLVEDDGRIFRWNKTKDKWDEQPAYAVYADAHVTFAQLDSDGQYVWETNIHISACIDDANNHSEEFGIAYCKELFGEHTLWAQSGGVRNRAEPGRYLDKEKNLFLYKQPFPSWSLSPENNYQWRPPKAYPNDGKMYQWDENSLSWIDFKMDDK